MNDPHVERLTYKMVLDGSTSFDALAREWEEDDAKIKVENDLISVELKTHFASEIEAKDRISDILDTWALRHALERRRQEFTVKFVDSHVIDRQPPKAGDGIGALKGTVAFKGSAKGGIKTCSKLSVSHNEYPDKPKPGFKATKELRDLWDRYRTYQNTKQLLAEASWVLSSLEASIPQTDAKSRKACAEALNVEFAVLDMLGRLTSSHGSHETARKRSKRHELKEFTNRQESWVIEVIPKLLKHAGHYYGGSAAELPELTMADLPADGLPI